MRILDSEYDRCMQALTLLRNLAPAATAARSYQYGSALERHHKVVAMLNEYIFLWLVRQPATPQQYEKFQDAINYATLEDDQRMLAEQEAISYLKG